MASIELQPIAPRSAADSQRWVRYTPDGEAYDVKRTPDVEESIRVLREAMDYLEDVKGKPTRLAGLLGNQPGRVFHWLSGRHTPSAKHLIKLIDLILIEAKADRVSLSYLRELASQPDSSPREAA